MSRDYFTFVDGEELADLKDVVYNPLWVIMTREIWEKVVLCPTGLVDGKAVILMVKVLGLDGLRIVRHSDSLLVPCDAQGSIFSEDCPVVLYDGYGHFKALHPLHTVPLVSSVFFIVFVCCSCEEVKRIG